MQRGETIKPATFTEIIGSITKVLGNEEALRLIEKGRNEFRERKPEKSLSAGERERLKNGK